MIGLWLIWLLEMPAPVAGPVGVSVYESLTAYRDSIVLITADCMCCGLAPHHLTTRLPPACLQLVNADNLSLVDDASAQATLIAIAAHFPARDRGTVRLIDNTVVGPQ